MKLRSVFAQGITFQESLLLESLSASTIDLLPCVTWVLDIRNNRFYYVSPNIVYYFGYSVRDYLERGYLFHEAAIHRDDLSRVSSEILSMRRAFLDELDQQSQSFTRSSNYRILSKCGKSLLIQEHSSVFSRNLQGVPTLLVSCLFIDSDQKSWREEENRSHLYCDAMGQEDRLSLEPTSISSVDLTKREREILKLISDGKTSKDISQLLSISFHTVNTHRQKIIEKTGKRNIGAVIQYAVSHGII